MSKNTPKSSERKRVWVYVAVWGNDPECVAFTHAVVNASSEEEAYRLGAAAHVGDTVGLLNDYVIDTEDR